MKRILRSGVLLTVAVLSSCAINEGEFRPVVFDEHTDSLKEHPEMMTPGFRRQLEGVLKKYNEPYRVTSDGKVMVRRGLVWDEDLRWNYTTKANNGEGPDNDKITTSGAMSIGNREFRGQLPNESSSVGNPARELPPSP